MTGFVFAAIVLAWLMAIVYFGGKAVCGSFVSGLCVCALLIGGFGVVINAVIAEKETGPCLRYETGMHYSPATRTMMPYRTCAERGEWIE